ncbi:MaoC family dehydratase [Serratia sp. M24T3]|nr:MaoC family dehydratase [Serratia sp. M24T3]EIC82124.1 MaoC domain-containing protein [Serratia sp. M24T3]
MPYTILELSVGQSASFTKTISDADVLSFAKASGDMNPVHIDEEAGKLSVFKNRVVHGILVSGLISAALASELPGAGTIYLGQELKFIKPTFIGDTITAHIEVIEIDLERKRVRLSTTCVNQHGDAVIKGIATVLPPQPVSREA